MHIRLMQNALHRDSGGGFVYVEPINKPDWIAQSGGQCGAMRGIGYSGQGR